MRSVAVAVVTAVVLACSGERSVGVEREEVRKPEGVREPERRVEDPREACVRAYASGDAAYVGVVRALCAELHDLGGVSASVAIVRDDRVVWSVAVGPRCHGRGEGLRASTPVQIGSITKLVTAALALGVAQREGVGLDDPLAMALPELSPAPSLRQLMTHTSGLRDPDPSELLVRGDAWPEALQLRREPAGGYVYANANFLLVGRWLERAGGRAYAQLWAEEPGLAAVRERVTLDREGASALACTHRRGSSGEWEATEASAEPPLPAWTLPAGGGLASADDLARLPFALEQTGALPLMLATRVPSDRPGWDYGLGVRMHGEGDALVLAHSGNTGAHWAELQWSPKHRVAVAVVASTPQALKATLLAAFTAAERQERP
jgi:CubicO group peptidase (beta-lactamase class C family)